MTETQSTEPLDLDDAEARAKALSLVREGILKVQAGTLSLPDLLGAVLGEHSGGEVDKKPPVPKALTEEQKEALKRLPDVYGKVVVTADRKLTKQELAALVEERQIVDTLLAPLKARKDESIREVLSNHLDNVLSEEEQAAAVRDAKGHFAVKQEVSVEGMAKKVQRSVSGGKPRLDISHIEELHEQGLIDRKTYLAVTRKPDLPRVLDEVGLHAAIQKNPSLFFLLASKAEPTTPTTTIKVVKDS